MRPLEVLAPILTAKNMLAMGNGPLVIELLKKVRPVCNAVYFGADHIVSPHSRIVRFGENMEVDKAYNKVLTENGHLEFSITVFRSGRRKPGF